MFGSGRHEGGWFSLVIAPVSDKHVDHGSGHSAPCRLEAETAEDVGFPFGGLFHMLRRGRHEGVSSGLRAASGEDGTRVLVFCGGTLLPFVLRVVAGACVGRRSGQPRMPPRERQHEGVRGYVGSCGRFWSGGVLTTGVVVRAVQPRE